MITQISLYINQVPQTYVDLLNCFDILKSKNIDKETFNLLVSCNCHVPQSAVAILQDELIKTINIMLNRCIKEFRKDFQMSLDYSEFENIYNVFTHLAVKLKYCLFFSEYKFLDEKFVEELYISYQKQVKSFWSKTVNSIYQQCIEESNLILENELYMIKRIHLFDVDIGVVL